MTWTYSDYITYTDGAAAWTRRALHIKEVSDKLTQEMASDSYSKSSMALERYLDRLKTEHFQDTANAPNSTNDTTSVARLVRCRDAR